MEKDVSQMTAQERADKVGCMIKEKIDAGEFSLLGGYVQANTKGHCAGCAVGSLAYTLGCPAPSQPGFSYNGSICRSYIQKTASDLITLAEQAQLEMGYEAWESLQFFGEKYYADTSNPFFQLGKKMSIKSRHRGPSYYLHIEGAVEAAKRSGYARTTS